MHGHGLATSVMDGAAGGACILVRSASTTTKTLQKPTAKTV